jgi:hypothetical protein
LYSLGFFGNALFEFEFELSVARQHTSTVGASFFESTQASASTGFDRIRATA